MEIFSEIFGQLYGAIIDNLSIDLLKKTINFELTVCEGIKKSNYSLNFDAYDSILWLEKDRYMSSDYDIKKCDYFELTAITSNNINLYTKNNWLQQFDIGFNIAIEIWESVLLIKTDKLYINGREYIIK